MLFLQFEIETRHYNEDMFTNTLLSYAEQPHKTPGFLSCSSRNQ
jgi:hypothetical protein